MAKSSASRALTVGGRTVSSNVRRHPVQARTQRKVVDILKATALLIESMPLDAITTTEIAKAAGITTGTVYRFFPHREAIFESLLIGYWEKLRANYEETLMYSKARTGAEITGEVIDLQVRFMLTEPGFKVLWTNRDVASHLVDRMRESNGGIPALAKIFVAQQLGVRVTPEIERRMLLTTVITDNVLVYAFRQPEAERNALVAELKRLLTFIVFGPEESPIAYPPALEPPTKASVRKKRAKS